MTSPRIPSLPTTLAAVPITPLYSASANLAVTAIEQSAFLDVNERADLRIVRTATGGVYALELDWSRDGVAVDVVETVAVPNNGRVVVPVATRYVRVRVRNTDTVAAFTAHRTTVSAR